MEEEMIKVWQMGMYNYDDIGLDKPVMYKEDFLKQIADDVQTANITKGHSNEIISSLSNLKYVNGGLYANKPTDIDITGYGLSPVFDCDLVDMGDYYEPRNFTMTSVGLTKNPRSEILYNSIKTSFVTNGTKGDGKVSEEFHKMLDKKEETIAEQREEIGILKKQMEELRAKSKENEDALDGYKDLQKQFDELKANAETYKADSDRLREQEAKAKEKLIKEIVGDDAKGMEMFQKFSVEELEHMKNTKIVTEPVRAVGSQSVDTITDGDADDIPSEDQVDEYSQEYFEKWEQENTHW